MKVKSSEHLRSLLGAPYAVRALLNLPRLAGGLVSATAHPRQCEAENKM